MPYIILGIIILLAVAVLIYFISAYNGFIALKNKCEEAFSAMDVHLKKRYDLIPNLVSAVKGYARHESQTMENVISARNAAASSANPEEKIQNENILNDTLKSLFAVAENYPDLKANANFMSLQNSLSDIENEIAMSRKYYNAVIRDYNTKTESFPSNIIANMFKFTQKPMYEVSDSAERENVKVEF